MLLAQVAIPIPLERAFTYAVPDQYDALRSPVAPIGESQAQFYVSFDVVDRPGVLARCAAIFGEHDVSLRIVQQSYREGGDHEAGFAASLGVMTHLSLVSQYGGRMLVVVVLSTLIGMAVTALVLHALRDKATPEKDHAQFR